MTSQQKSDFSKRCRELRVAKGLKQREVAEKIGVKASTYGNVESSPFKIIGADKVARLISLYNLNPAQALELSQLWQAVPLSEYGERQRKTWEKRNKMRSKAKHHDRLMLSLTEVLGCFLPIIDAIPANVCACSFDREDSCEVCVALENLGLDPFTTVDAALAQLGPLQTKLEAAQAGAAS